MAFGIFQGDFFPISPDEILVGSFGGKGAEREILFPEETLLQFSCMVREKKIVEPAAVIPKPFAGQGFDVALFEWGDLRLDPDLKDLDTAFRKKIGPMMKFLMKERKA